MWGACRLGKPEGGHTQGATLGAHPAPPPRPKAHAAEFCQHEAESRAEPEQQSGQDIFSAGRARVRGRMGEGLASDCTSRLYPASLLLLAPNLGKIKDHPGEPLEGLGLPERRASCSTGTRPSPLSPLRSAPAPRAPRPAPARELSERRRRAQRCGGGGARRGGAERRGERGRAPRSYASSARGDPGRRPRPLTCPRRRAACHPRDWQAPPAARFTRVGGRPRGRGRAGLGRL